MRDQPYYNILKARFDNFELMGNHIDHLTGWSNVDYQFLKFCLVNKVIDMRILRDLVRKRLRKIGRDSFLYLVRNKHMADQSADHVPSPIALAFAVEEREFTPFELEHIHFDHRDTAETFMQEERKQFLTRIVRQMTDWMNRPEEREEPPS